MSYWGFWAREKLEGRQGGEAIDLAIPPTIYVCKNIATVND